MTGPAQPGIWLEVITGGDAAAIDGFYAAGRLQALQGIPGLVRIRRCPEVDGPRHVLIAELDDVAAARDPLRAGLDGAPRLDTAPAPQTRGILAADVPGTVAGDQDAPGITFLVAMAVNPEREAEYNRWYDTEHIPILLEHDGWLAARRYRCESPVAEYLTVYRVASEHVVTPEVRAAVRATEWSRDVLATAFVTHTRAFLTDHQPPITP